MIKTAKIPHFLLLLMSELSSSAELRRAGRWAVGKGWQLEDVPWDGNCVAHAVAPAFAVMLRRRAEHLEIRAMLVAAASLDPAQEDDLRTELAVEVEHGTRGVATVADLLAYWAEPGRFLPPILVARATQLLTGVPVRVFALASGSATDDPILIHQPDALDGPAPVPPHLTLLHFVAKSHVCRIIPAAAATTTTTDQ